MSYVLITCELASLSNMKKVLLIEVIDNEY